MGSIFSTSQRHKKKAYIIGEPQGFVNVKHIDHSGAKGFASKNSCGMDIQAQFEMLLSESKNSVSKSELEVKISTDKINVTQNEVQDQQNAENAHKSSEEINGIATQKSDECLQETCLTNISQENMQDSAQDDSDGDSQISSKVLVSEKSIDEVPLVEETNLETTDTETIESKPELQSKGSISSKDEVDSSDHSSTDLTKLKEPLPEEESETQVDTEKFEEETSGG